MNAVNVTNARKNLYQLIADVNSNSKPVVITNSRGKNAVLLSEDDWEAIRTKALNGSDFYYLGPKNLSPFK